MPDTAYLVGGIALAIHLQHRQSKDLDFFYHDRELDLDALHAALSRAGDFVATDQDADTLNGYLGKTKLQFLHDAGHRLEEPKFVAGLQIAGMRDLMATKLRAIIARSELRDYFDLMAIETKHGRTVEAGLQDFVERYRPKVVDSALISVVKALGYLNDVDEDNLVPLPKSEIEAYWHRRQPQLLKAFARW